MQQYNNYKCSSYETGPPPFGTGDVVAVVDGVEDVAVDSVEDVVVDGVEDVGTVVG